jgi:LuxR family transcriptional regulator, quorum-sensing system regulator CciR
MKPEPENTSLGSQVAQSVSEETDVAAPCRSTLTPRQRDCVVLVARGKSDRQIAAILGISNQTVHKHVESAKQRYAVATRTELVVRALFMSQVSLAEIMS